MNTNVLIVIVIVILIAVGGFFFFQSGDEMSAPETENGEARDAAAPASTAPSVEEDAIPSEAVVIRYTDNGYTPDTATVRERQTATFVNESSGNMWPATAIHPTHTVYPGSDIKKCNTEERVAIFDACEPIPPGGTWSFSFTDEGSWKYHDHLNLRNTATINVVR